MKIKLADKLACGFVVAATIALLSWQAVVAQVTLPQVTTVGPTDLIQVIPGGQPSVGNKYGNAGQVNGPLGLQTSTPLTAFSLTFNNGTTYWFITPAGTLATGTFLMDANAGNGQRACVESTQTQTAVTITGGANQNIGGTPVTAMTANTTYCWVYVALKATWYPITI